MPGKIRMWEFTKHGKLRGVVSEGTLHPNRCMRIPHAQATIETSRIIGVRTNGADTVIRTQSGSEYQLDGPSRLDLIREADTPKE